MDRGGKCGRGRGHHTTIDPCDLVSETCQICRVNMNSPSFYLAWDRKYVSTGRGMGDLGQTEEK